MRLVDADKTYKELIDSIEWLREQDYETYSAIGDDIGIILDKQPTAFDADRVTETLEEVKNTYTKLALSVNDGVEKAKYIAKEQAMSLAIEIVKGGGIE